MDGVQVGKVSQKGRGLFLKRKVYVGDVIFIENPLVSCQFPHNQDHGYLACDHCIKPLETVHQNLCRLAKIPDIELPNFPDNLVNPAEHVECETCHAKYCGAECRQNAYESYHKSLCAAPDTDEARAIQKLRQFWKDIHYPPEESTVMLILRLLAIIHQSPDKDAILTQVQDYITPCRSKLTTRFVKKEATGDLLSNLINCVEILKLDVHPDFLTLSGFCKVLGMLALNSQGIATSSFAQWVQRHDTTIGSDKPFDDFADAMYEQLDETVGVDFLNNEGSGLYKIQSKMNHSCQPNTEIVFPHSNHTLAVKALQDMESDTELTFSYIDECVAARSRHSRQKIIMEKFMFKCYCVKCETEVLAPDETSEEDSEMDES